MNVFCFSQCTSFSMLAVGDKDMSSHLFIYNTVHFSLSVFHRTHQNLSDTLMPASPHTPPLSLKDMIQFCNLQYFYVFTAAEASSLPMTSPGSFSWTPTLAHYTRLTLSEFLSTFILPKLPQNSSIISEHSSDFPTQISKWLHSLYPKQLSQVHHSNSPLFVIPTSVLSLYCKHYSKVTLMGEGFIQIYPPGQQFTTEVSQGLNSQQKLEQKLQRNATYWLAHRLMPRQLCYRVQSYSNSHGTAQSESSPVNRQ